jgi:serine/threonine-protein kinase
MLHDEIASGGMASVHLGKMCGPVGFAPIVAIKSLHAHYAKDPEFVRMFQDEARLAGRIRHPNIVPVLDVYAAEGVLFLVLEYVHGESLAHLLAASRRQGAHVSLAVASAVMCDVLHGLHAAHEAKGERGEPLEVVHRDVSPQNVMVGVDGSARVLDFGVAKAAGRMQTTSDGQVKGKFAYMAPEQLRGELVNRQADVYAAAVVLWEILSSKRLFGGESEGNTVQKVLFGEVPPPSASRTDVPPALDAVVMRGLARERSQRFSTAKEMALALQAAVAPAPAPVVGEWVEARALDALEKRRLVVAAMESSAVPAPASAAPPAGPAASSPPALPVVVDEGTTAGQSVPDVGAQAAPSHRSPALGRLAVAGAAGVLCAGGLAFALFMRPHATAPSADPPAALAAAAPVASVASASVAPSIDPVPSEEPPPVPVAPPADPRKPARKVSTGGPRSSVARPPAPATSTVSCARHGADGLITFDTECLRSAGRRP